MPDHSLKAGLVLAGGESRRFGSNKLFADFGGTTMVEHVVDLLSGMVDEVYVSVSDAEMLPFNLRSRTVRDVVKGIGPLGGVYSGLLASSSDWLVVMAADLPYVTKASIGRLIERSSKDPVAVVACGSDGRKQPLAACYHRSTIPAAEACIAAGQVAMKHFIGRLEKVEYIGLPDPELTNVNRPEDLERRTSNLERGTPL